ncbi:MAG: DNA polymerase IV [Desulfobacterales bacterium]|nr:DNA polymerase IV [Desulfobacterales bacterium]
MIVHVDMDAFFASVEKKDDPALAGRCVIVGGISDRGVVSAASYEARKFGVRSAMPMYRARRLCPEGVFLSPRPRRYKEISRRIMDVLSGFSPLVEPVSIDEAYLDIAGCGRLLGDPKSIGAQIKQAVCRETGLTCSVGLASLKFLSKIASDLEKPDGLVVISMEQTADFIYRLPVQKVPGVGRVAGQKLERMGISTLGDVAGYDKAVLVRHLGSFGTRLHELAMGVDRSRVTPVRPVKSVSAEQTLAADTRDKNELKTHLLAHAEDVGRQLRRHRLRAKTVFIKIKHSDFTQVTRQAPLEQTGNCSAALYRTGADLLDAYRFEKPVRLVGLGASDLADEHTPVQQSLFAENGAVHEKWEKIDTAMDAIWEKYGARKIIRARAMDPSDPGGDNTSA